MSENSKKKQRKTKQKKVDVGFNDVKSLKKRKRDAQKRDSESNGEETEVSCCCRLPCIFGRRRRKRKKCVHRDLPNGNIAETLTDSKTETDERETQKLGLNSEKNKTGEKNYTTQAFVTDATRSKGTKDGVSIEKNDEHLTETNSHGREVLDIIASSPKTVASLTYPPYNSIYTLTKLYLERLCIRRALDFFRIVAERSRTRQPEKAKLQTETTTPQLNTTRQYIRKRTRFPSSNCSVGSHQFIIQNTTQPKDLNVPGSHQFTNQTVCHCLKGKLMATKYFDEDQDSSKLVIKRKKEECMNVGVTLPNEQSFYISGIPMAYVKMILGEIAKQSFVLKESYCNASGVRQDIQTGSQLNMLQVSEQSTLQNTRRSEFPCFRIVVEIDKVLKTHGSLSELHLAKIASFLIAQLNDRLRQVKHNRIEFTNDVCHVNSDIQGYRQPQLVELDVNEHFPRQPDPAESGPQVTCKTETITSPTVSNKAKEYLKARKNNLRGVCINILFIRPDKRKVAFVRVPIKHVNEFRQLVNKQSVLLAQNYYCTDQGIYKYKTDHVYGYTNNETIVRLFKPKGELKFPDKFSTISIEDKRLFGRLSKEAFPLKITMSENYVMSTVLGMPKQDQIVFESIVISDKTAEKWLFSFQIWNRKSHKLAGCKYRNQTSAKVLNLIQIFLDHVPHTRSKYCTNQAAEVVQTSESDECSTHSPYFDRTSEKEYILQNRQHAVNSSDNIRKQRSQHTSDCWSAHHSTDYLDIISKGHYKRASDLRPQSSQHRCHMSSHQWHPNHSHQSHQRLSNDGHHASTCLECLIKDSSKKNIKKIDKIGGECYEYQVFGREVPTNLNDILIPFKECSKEALVTYTEEDELVVESGDFGEMFYGIKPAVEKEVNIKLIKNRESSLVEREAKIQIYLQPGGYVPTLIGIIGQRTGTDFIMLQEFCATGFSRHFGNTLQDVVDARLNGKLIIFTKHWLNICFDLAICLQDMHTHGVLHNNIKPENILIDFQTPDVEIYYTNFGHATFRRGMKLDITEVKRNRAVQSYHLAPEVRQGRLSSPASDIYSLGVVFKGILEPFCDCLQSLPYHMCLDDPNERLILNEVIELIDLVRA